MGINKKIIFFTFCIIFLFSKISYSDQIYDHETETFINNLIVKVLSVNNFEKKIKVKIIKDDNPNAFVIPRSELIITSGLIEQVPDYVSLLAVLAHEIGHLEYLHLEKRKDSIEDISKIKLLSNLAMISGTLITGNHDVFGAAIASQININNYYLNFTKEQEREADYYAIHTLNKLRLPSSSVLSFLKILENNALNRGIDEHHQKFSTHPFFKERFQIIENFEKITEINFDKKMDNDFKFIKAKFMAHNNNVIKEKLNGDHQIYYDSIIQSKKGNFNYSLKKINLLIKKYPNNFYFLETKADILRSHGYIYEALKFYQTVNIAFPDNNYVKFRIFIDTNLTNLSIKNKKLIFKENLSLLISFYNNKYIIKKYNDLAKNIKNDNWIIFFNILSNSSKINKEKYFEELNNLYNDTNDLKLKQLIEAYKIKI